MTRLTRHQHYDTVVIGARCAGAATARLLAKGGQRVLLVDRDPKLGDTLSTHALMWPGVLMLQKWGLLERLLPRTSVIETVHLHYGADVCSLPALPRAGAPGLVAPRRDLLDPVLCDAATESGAELCLGVRFIEPVTVRSGRVVGARLLSPDGDTISVTCDCLVGADGRASRVADTVNAATTRSAHDWTAALYGYVTGLPNEGHRWF